MRKIRMGLFLACLSFVGLACSGRSNGKTIEKGPIAMAKLSGLQAKLISVCFHDFEQMESKEFTLDFTRFDVLFDEAGDTFAVTFVFHGDGTDRAGGRSKWGRDVKYEISKAKYEIVGRKFFK